MVWFRFHVCMRFSHYPFVQGGTLSNPLVERLPVAVSITKNYGF